MDSRHSEFETCNRADEIVFNRYSTLHQAERSAEVAGGAGIREVIAQTADERAALAQSAREFLAQAARAFGAQGGAATKGVSTPRRARASRRNGKLGGRPALPEAQIRAAIQASGLRPVRHGRRHGFTTVAALRIDGTAAFFIHPAGEKLAVDASMPGSDLDDARQVALALNAELLTK